MGHKVHPTGFRLGIIKDWQSKWYSDTHYAEFVKEDKQLRDEIRAKYREAAISLIEIDRQAKDVTITLYTARPGIVIGRGGQRVDEMRQHLEQLIGKKVRLNIQEVRQPEMDAYLVARSVAEQIERRIAYRRAMKQAIFRTIQAGAKGIKVSCAGRLGNAEIARRQTSAQGQVPLHTLRADIDYGFTEAHTTLGRIGVKVWIYKGQVLPEIRIAEAEEKPAEAVEDTAVVGEQEVKPVETVDEAAAVVEQEAKPVETVGETTAVEEPEEKPAAVNTEASPTAEAVEKQAKPRTRKTAKATETKEPETANNETAVTEDKPPEEEPAAPKRRRKTSATTETEAGVETASEVAPDTESTGTEKEEDKDATTEAS